MTVHPDVVHLEGEMEKKEKKNGDSVEKWGFGLSIL